MAPIQCMGMTTARKSHDRAVTSSTSEATDPMPPHELSSFSKWMRSSTLYESLRCKAAKAISRCPLIAVKIRPSDLVQHAMATACAKRHQLRAGDRQTFQAWLGKIIERRLLEQIRRLRRERPLASELDGSIPLLDPQPTPATALVHKLNLSESFAALSELPQLQREVLHLLYVEKVGRQNVAKRLNMSLNQLDYERKKARDYLRSRWARLDGRG